MTYHDVIRRAAEILRRGPLEDACEPHCVRCALAQAKSELDREQGAGVEVGELLRQAVFGWEEVASDEPLVRARDQIGAVETKQEGLTLEEAIETLRRAECA